MTKDTLIRPVMLYNSDIWFMEEYAPIYKSLKRSEQHGSNCDILSLEEKFSYEKIHNKFCKSVLGLKKTACKEIKFISWFSNKIMLTGTSDIKYRQYRKRKEKRYRHFWVKICWYNAYIYLCYIVLLLHKPWWQTLKITDNLEFSNEKRTYDDDESIMIIISW